MLNSKEIKNIIECLLFVANEPLSINKLNKLTDISFSLLRENLKELQVEYEGRGLQIIEVGGGYQIVTRPQYASYVRKLISHPPRKLSQAALETLAIIAYRQPITRVEIENIRGVNVDGLIDHLLERRLIKIVGRKNSPGRPFIYTTTAEFLRYFGLNSLEELPRIDQNDKL